MNHNDSLRLGLYRYHFLPIMPIPCPAASIWFEIWGGCGSGSKNFDFLGKFPKNLDFSGNFTNKKIDFSRQIFEKFRFFQVISQKISTFQAKFSKNFVF